ncbi:MAG: TSUP family transporter [Bacteroidales bacterium]
MTLSTLIILLIIGIIAGAFSGLVGLGGALIIIPAIVFIFGTEQHIAQGTALAIMLPPVGFLAAYNYYKKGHLNISYAALIALGFFFGSYFGAKVALDIPSDVLRKIFAVVLFLLALRFLFKKK